MAKRETEGERHTRLHNKGEQDAGDNNYKPPTLSRFLTELTGSKSDMEDIEAYDKGWENAKKQK